MATANLHDLFDELDAHITDGRRLFFGNTYGPGGPRIVVRNADSAEIDHVIIVQRINYRLIDDGGDMLVPRTAVGISAIVDRLMPTRPA